MELDKGEPGLSDTVAEHIPPDFRPAASRNDGRSRSNTCSPCAADWLEYLGSLFPGLKLVFTPAAGYTETEHLDWIRRRAETTTARPHSRIHLPQLQLHRLG